MTCVDPGCGKTKLKCDACRVWVRRWVACEPGNSSVAGVPFIGRIGMFGHLKNEILYNSYKDACDANAIMTAENGRRIHWIIEIEVEE